MRLEKRFPLLVALMVMALPWGVQAGTYLVGSGGYSTIQAALDAAAADGTAAGDTVWIANGTYALPAYIANYDPEADHAWTGSGNVDFSGLTIRGESQGGVVLDMGTIPVGDCDSYQDEPYCPKWRNGVWNFPAPFVFQAARVSSPFDPKAGANGPNYRRATSLANGETRDKMGYQGHYNAWKNHPNTTNPDIAFLPFIQNIKISTLTVRNSYAGVYVEGPFRNFTIENVNFDQCYFGVSLRQGTESVSVQSSNFTNCKFGVGILENCTGTQVLGNTFTLTDSVLTDAPGLYSEGNPFVGVLQNAGEPLFPVPPLHGFSGNGLFNNNTFDYTSYSGDVTLTKEAKAFELQGSANNTLANNTVLGAHTGLHVNTANTVGHPSANTVEEMEFMGGDQGVLDEYVNNLTLKNSTFSDFRFPAAGGIGWGFDSGAGYWSAFSARNVAQYLAVPYLPNGTDNYQLAFTHAFNIALDNKNQVPPFKKTAPECDLGHAQVLVSFDDGNTVQPLLSDQDAADAGYSLPYTRFCWCTEGNWMNSTYTLPNNNNGQPVWVLLELDDATANWTCDNVYGGPQGGWFVDNFEITNTSTTGVIADENSGDLETLTYPNQYGAWFSNYASGPGGTLVDGCRFLGSYSDGIVYGDPTSAGGTAVGGTNNVTATDLVNNQGYGLLSYNSTVNAADNFWGDNNGPWVEGRNETTGGEEIYDPNTKVTFSPWQKPLQSGNLNDSNGAVIIYGSSEADTSRFACATSSSWSAQLYAFSGNLSNPFTQNIGEFGCANVRRAVEPTYTDGGTFSPGDVLIRFESNPGEMPLYRDGDFLMVNPQDGSGAAVEAFVPGNLNNLYGDYLLLWVDSDGTTYFACLPGNRNSLTPDVTLAQAKAERDFYLAKEARVQNFTIQQTPGSDYNWVGDPYFRSDLAQASELFAKIVQDNGNSILRTISKWNPISQTFTQYSTVPFPIGNFPLEISGAYRVEVSQNGTFTSHGAVPTLDSIDFHIQATAGSNFNWVALPFYRNDLTFAANLLGDVNAKSTPAVSVVTVEQWNPVSQSFTTYTVFPPVGNFTVATGRAYRLGLASGTTPGEYLYQPDRN